MARAEALPRPPTVEMPAAPARRWRFFAVLAALAVAHVVGWQTTRINLPALVAGLPNATHIVSSLASPDAFEPIRDEASVEGQISFVTPGAPAATAAPATPAATTVTSDGGQTLVVSPPAVAPGEIVYVQGKGWPAG